MIPKKYAALACLPLLLGLLWFLWQSGKRDNAAPLKPVPVAGAAAALPATSDNSGSTEVFAHNLRLRKGPVFRIYVRWIHGHLLRTHAAVQPSFDDPDSFVFLIEKGVVHANLGDIGNFMNATMPPKFPFRKVTVVGEGEQIRLSGTLRKLLLPLPIEILGTLSPVAEGHIRLHVTAINVLKLPMKTLLGRINVQINDIMGSAPMRGIEVAGNDLIFDTTTFLPPPHIRGQLTSITVARPDLVLIYGNSPNDEAELSQWHNFLRLIGGTISFGKLTMHHADLTLIDASSDPWFDLDLVNYQSQLVRGYSRMTPDNGLEMFLPNLTETGLPPGESIRVEDLRNRKLALPAEIPMKK